MLEVYTQPSKSAQLELIIVLVLALVWTNTLASEQLFASGLYYTFFVYIALNSVANRVDLSTLRPFYITVYCIIKLIYTLSFFSLCITEFVNNAESFSGPAVSKFVTASSLSIAVLLP